MNGNPLLDAETTLVGWTNRSAIRNLERTFLSGEEVLLTTKLDAASRFSVVASNPGSVAAVEIQVSFAPVLRDGTTGSWVVAATVALPAEGGRVEAFISGRDIQLNAADLADVDLPAVCFAKAEVSPETPEGMHVGLIEVDVLSGTDALEDLLNVRFDLVTRNGLRAELRERIEREAVSLA